MTPAILLAFIFWFSSQISSEESTHQLTRMIRLIRLWFFTDATDYAATAAIHSILKICFQAICIYICDSSRCCYLNNVACAKCTQSPYTIAATQILCEWMRRFSKRTFLKFYYLRKVFSIGGHCIARGFCGALVVLRTREGWIVTSLLLK